MQHQADRRSFLATLLGGAGAALVGAAAWWQTTRGGLRSAARGPRRTPQPGAAPVATEPPAIPFLKPGTRVHTSTVVAVGPLHLGAVPVHLRAPDGAVYQVDVLARAGDPPGIANTRTLSLYLANRGNGRVATPETWGLAVLALGRTLARYETAGWRLDGLQSFAARINRFPQGRFTHTV